MKTLKILSTLVLCAFATVNTAYAADMQPGEYVVDGGHGTLVVQPKKNGRFPFSIETMTVNGHTCALAGDIIGMHADVKESLDAVDDACKFILRQ